jgi:hypothetical protein
MQPLLTPHAPAPARSWRAVLLSNEEGFWDPTQDVAFVLLANNQVFPPSALQGFQLVASLFSNLGRMMVESFITGSAADTTQQAGGAVALAANARRMAKERQKRKAAKDAGVVAAPTDKDDKLDRGNFTAWGAAGDDATFTVDDGEDGEEVPGDTDPMSFSADAIQETMPAELQAALAHDTVLAGRVWTTALVVAFLESNELFTWRVSPPSTPLAEQLTLVDVAQQWLAAQLGALPAAPEDLGKAVAWYARRQVGRWAKFHDRRITKSRGAHISTREHARLQMYNAASQVHSTLVNGHPTVGLFMSELSIGFTRWMGMHVLVSALMAMLVVNIWCVAGAAHGVRHTSLR